MKKLKNPAKIKRRKFISRAGSGAALVMAWPFLSSCDTYSDGKDKSGTSSDKQKTEPNKDFKPDIDIELNAGQSEAQLFPGEKTTVWTFESQLIKGNENALQKIEDSYLGPIIRVSKGQKVRIRFKNDLPEESIVHWHGMHVPEEDDGHPKDVIPSGETYIYEYEILNRAGTYWFHPHPHGRTGAQVYNGLAGLLIVTDDEEQSLNLPEGEYDVPVVIQDRSFDSNNQLVYLDGRMDRMTGFLGDRILINGKADQSLKLKAGCKYRLRLLNGSNSRIYKLGWDNGKPITVFGVDGSLLGSPKKMPYLMLGPAKRADVWLDLTDVPEGTELTMKNMSFPLEVMSGGMMDGGMMDGNKSLLPQGSVYDVLTIKTQSSGSNNFTLPDNLVNFNPINPSDTINFDSPRQFTFAMDHMEWTINGRTWETTGVAEEEKVKLGTAEVWELINKKGGMMMGNGDHPSGNEHPGGGGMMGDEEGMMNGNDMMNMMQMPHPVHIHQVQFNILERNVEEVDPALWSAIKEGFIKEGWHDTVLLMPGMRVKVIMQFKDFKGLFVYHCHNLEHEDMGMMRNFEVI